MFRSVIGFILLLLTLTVQAQIDPAQVPELLAQKGGYATLTERFETSDTTLSIEDFQLIYYGYQTTAVYYSKDIEFNENLLKPLSRSGQYKQVIDLADSILRLNPVSIAAHFEKAYACAQLGFNEGESFHRKRYIVLCNVIKLSGNGSIAQPYACNSTNDAVEFILFKGFTAIDDRKTSSGVIEFDLAKNKQKVLHLYISIPAQAYTPPDSTSDSE